MDSFEQDSAAFLNWFEHSNGTRVSDKIRIADLRKQSAGRAVVAAKDIAEDEELFALKDSLVLSPQTSDISKHMTLPDSDSWLPLILTIIYELQRGTNSPWSAYLRLLPADFDTLMFWSADELAQLKGCEVVNKIGKESTEHAWRQTLVPIILEHPNLFPCPGSSEQEKTINLINLAHRAGSLIMAYAFDVNRDDSNENEDDSSVESSLVSDDDEDGTTFKGLVPFADLLNADADRNNAKLFAEDGYLVMKATMPVMAGEEIFNDYGPLPRSDLLRMYGYVTPNYAQFDVVELHQTDIIASAQTADKDLSALQRENMNALDELGLLDDGYVIQRTTETVSNLVNIIPSELHMLLRALTCNLGNDTGKPLRKGIKEYFTIEEASLLAAICTRRLKDYTTSIEEDIALLQKLETSPSTEPNVSPYRLKMAVQVRKGEKEILHAVLGRCHAHIEKLTSEIKHDVLALKRKHQGDDVRSTKQMKGNDKKRIG